MIGGSWLTALFTPPTPQERAQQRLADMVAAKARSPEVVEWRKRREAALRGRS